MKIFGIYQRISTWVPTNGIQLCALVQERSMTSSHKKVLVSSFGINLLSEMIILDMVDMILLSVIITMDLVQ